MFYCQQLRCHAGRLVLQQLRLSLQLRQHSSNAAHPWSRLLQGRPGAPQLQAQRLRTVRCFSSAAEQSGEKKKVVFCGTPEVAALVLEKLLQAAAQPDATFEVSAVVSQPGRPKGRGNKKVPQPSEVEQLAVASGLAPSQILCPEKATDKQFLETLRQLAPDLCITAAYGNYLPTTFLSIPRHGTLNIHPSLLPKYRGAAPVQRALQDGVKWTGVTVAFTVKEMDAGPVLAQQKVAVDPEIQAPQLLTQLFQQGTELLLSNLDLVWAGVAAQTAVPQDGSQATHAAKIGREESALDFGSSTAQALHDRVRAFAGWPSTTASFELLDPEQSGGSGEQLELKVVRTRVAPAAAWAAGGGSGGVAGQRQVHVSKEGMFVRCGDGSVLELVEVQAPGKKAVAAGDYANGLRGRVLAWRELPVAVAAAAS